MKVNLNFPIKYLDGKDLKDKRNAGGLVAAGIDPAGARCAIKGDECRNGNFSVTVSTPTAELATVEVGTETSATPAE